MSEWWTSLPTTLDQVWLRLTRGVVDRKADSRHPVLSTSGVHGAEARVIVLRGVERQSEKLIFYTDLRSAKVSEVLADPRASILVWEQKARLQIRLRARVDVTSGQSVSAQWAKVPETSRKVYGAEPAPGTQIDMPDQVNHPVDASHFAVLTCYVSEIETLHLGNDLHRRAKFSAANAWIGSWHSP